MPYVSDYGGNARQRGAAGGRKQQGQQNNSYRCLSCGKVSYYTKIQVARLKHHPHCTKCGGATEETEASFKRRVGKGKKVVGKIVGNMVVEYAPGKFQCVEGVRAGRCPVCDKPFRNPAAMRLHVEESHSE